MTEENDRRSPDLVSGDIPTGNADLRALIERETSHVLGNMEAAIGSADIERIRWGIHRTATKAAEAARAEGVAAAKEAAGLRHRATQIETLLGRAFVGPVGTAVVEMTAEVQRLRAEADALEEAAPLPGGQLSAGRVWTRQISPEEAVAAFAEREAAGQAGPSASGELAGWPEAFEELKRITGAALEWTGAGTVLEWPGGQVASLSRWSALTIAARQFQDCCLPGDPLRKELALFRARIAALGGGK